jgi:outer membrane autotransporter protein
LQALVKAGNANTADIKKKIETQTKVMLSNYNQLIRNTKKADELPSLLTSEEATTDGLAAVNDAVSSIIANRASLPFGIGLASGDEDDAIQYGAWVKGLFSKAEQKQNKLATGYTLSQAGGVIGFDIGDDYILGISYSAIKSKINAKKIKKTDDITSHIGTIYAAANFTNNMIASAQVHMGKSNIAKERTDASKNVYKATATATSMGGSAEVGYKFIYQPMNVALIPTVGIAHDSIEVSGYKEKAKSGICKEVKKRTVSKTSLTTSLALKNKKKLNSGLYLNSELKGRFSYAISSNNSNTVSKIADIFEITTKANKAPKYNMGFGGSVGISSDQGYDLSAGYELGLAEKFMSHTGFISARVKF